MPRRSSLGGNGPANENNSHQPKFILAPAPVIVNEELRFLRQIWLMLT